MRRKIAAGTVSRPAGPDDVALGIGYLRYLDDIFGRRSTLAPLSRRSRCGTRARAAWRARRRGPRGRWGSNALCGRAPLPARDDAGYVERVVGFARAETAATTVG